MCCVYTIYPSISKPCLTLYYVSDETAEPDLDPTYWLQKPYSLKKPDGVSLQDRKTSLFLQTASTIISFKGINERLCDHSAWSFISRPQEFHILVFPAE